MDSSSDPDTIRILVSTDNHVGYNERDPIRGDDSWRSFDEVMNIAKERDVDMVLLAGDLFHENKPSRKSMYQVMRSLRMNCYGDRPCELEFLSDASENFPGEFDHVNYEDLDINVAVPVFSIHGNHDDPSGEGHLAALDLLQVSGLINYYGRTPESDNIQVKPVLLQKGGTKLALYGVSNVRDERLFRTWKEGKVKFYQPGRQKDDWFNIISVHQNHHAYTETGYLPENFIPQFMDLVVWGHEHECLIDPRLNPETGFRVMQPGSSVATSLCPGEAVPKHVAILSITGRQFTSESIRLKTVRPFLMKEISLQDDPAMRKAAKKDSNRTEVTRYLMKIVEDLIKEAQDEWLEIQDQSEEDEGAMDVPLPLIRLRVEISTTEGGTFDVENPQRFSNRFSGRVANTNDVVQFHRSKKNTNVLRKAKADDAASAEAMSHLQGLDTVAVEKLVQEFLAAQSLTILPQNTFGDAVSQFIDKDDKHAMESFVNESLSSQIKHLMQMHKKVQRGSDDEEEFEEDDGEEIDLAEEMVQYRANLENLFEKGQIKFGRTRKFKPKPDDWDSEFEEGHWEDQPGALITGSSYDEDSELEEDNAPSAGRKATTTSRGRGRGRGRRAVAPTTARKPAASAKRSTVQLQTTRRAVAPSRSRKRAALSDDEDDSNAFSDTSMQNATRDQSVVEDSEPDGLFLSEKPTKSRSARARGGRRASTVSRASPAPSTTTRKPPPRRAAAAGAAKAKQSTLNFGASQASILGGVSQSQSLGSTGTGVGSRPSASASTRKRAVSPGDDIDDSEDDFEPITTQTRRSRR